MKTDSMKQFLIRLALEGSIYDNPDLVKAVMDFKLKNLSGSDAAKRNGIKHRNTVYRAAAHVDKIGLMVETIAPLMGFSWLYAQDRASDNKDYFKVVPVNPTQWRALCCGEIKERNQINLFVKINDSFIPL